MDKMNSGKGMLDDGTQGMADAVDAKKEMDSFEIKIRGPEIYRINSRTKEVEQVFQCINHCLRGDKADGEYAGDFECMEHMFSITGKESGESQYIINIFGDEMFTVTVGEMTETHRGKRSISAEYEECLGEYAASFTMERENTEVKVWITIN